MGVVSLRLLKDAGNPYSPRNFGHKTLYSNFSSESSSAKTFCWLPPSLNDYNTRMTSRGVACILFDLDFLIRKDTLLPRVMHIDNSVRNSKVARVVGFSTKVFSMFT
jgi:hypothetical protein